MTLAQQLQQRGIAIGEVTRRLRTNHCDVRRVLLGTESAQLVSQAQQDRIIACARELLQERGAA